MNILLIGNGVHANKRILPALKDLGIINSISILDRNVETEKQLSNTVKVLPYENLKKSNLFYDIGIIATPPYNHLQSYELVVNNCQTVLIEKPLTNNLDSIWEKSIQRQVGENKLIKNYLNILKNISKNNNFYPGSPLIISSLSSNSDKLYFCELHNNEFDSLKKNLNKFTNIKNINTDGFEYLEKKLDYNKSYFILIDPSYEIKDDFFKIYHILDNLEKYGNSKILIWYPILNYEDNDRFIENLRKKGISRIINFELPIISNSKDRGMKGSGLLIINFIENKILRDLKALSKELHFYLKQNDDVYNPKVRYL